jgi:hypothetical protein
MQHTSPKMDPGPKRARGRTTIEATPFITHARIGMSELTRGSIEERLRQALEPFGPRISRATLRFDDVNGPRGGPGLLCVIDVAFDSGEHVRIEQRATGVMEAVRRGMSRVVRSVRQHVERSERKTPRPTAKPRRAASADAQAADGASVRGSARPSARHPQHDGSQNDSGMSYALEDSQGKPSRKSTRASSNHIKAASQLTRRIQRKLQSPQARAAKSAA